MRRLFEFLRIRDDKPALEAPPSPPPPLLPVNRPRPITPSDHSNPIYVNHLGAFGRLPPELRRQILVAAFGQRLLHIDLRPVPRRPRSGIAHRGRIRSSLNPHAEREWRWISCVCHRKRSCAPEYYIWPHADFCLTGEALTCATSPPRGWPFGNCHYQVGALGWLRTCRQAYLEGISVLYGSNRFILQCPELLDLLLDPANTRQGHAILPHHLALGKSLEVQIDTMLFQTPGRDYSDGRYLNWNRRQSLPYLDGLIDAFPSLQSLVIVLTHFVYDDCNTRPAAGLPELQSVLLEPLAKAFSPFVSIQKRPFVVELPRGLFRELLGLGAYPVKTCEPRVHGWEWLQYPISGSGEGLFYYIKEGLNWGLYWNDEGKTRQTGWLYPME
jgi:hypothetical protein